uniref:Uncharacterized protein n=1 Tax=Anopheles farauti TaxID=69004 RepID=A0A182QDM2_9DIPT
MALDMEVGSVHREAFLVRRNLLPASPSRATARRQGRGRATHSARKKLGKTAGGGGGAGGAAGGGGGDGGDTANRISSGGGSSRTTAGSVPMAVGGATSASASTAAAAAQNVLGAAVAATVTVVAIPAAGSPATGGTGGVGGGSEGGGAGHGGVTTIGGTTPVPHSPTSATAPPVGKSIEQQVRFAGTFCYPESPSRLCSLSESINTFEVKCNAAQPLVSTGSQTTPTPNNGSPIEGQGGGHLAPPTTTTRTRRESQRSSKRNGQKPKCNRYFARM